MITGSPGFCTAWGWGFFAASPGPARKGTESRRPCASAAGRTLAGFPGYRRTPSGRRQIPRSAARPVGTPPRRPAGIALEPRHAQCLDGAGIDPPLPEPPEVRVIEQRAVQLRQAARRRAVRLPPVSHFSQVQHTPNTSESLCPARPACRRSGSERRTRPAALPGFSPGASSQTAARRPYPRTSRPSRPPGC